jgi:hypothetical protein
MSIAIGKGDNVLAMGVVEDFIYLNCSSSTNNIQVTDLFCQKETIIDRIYNIKCHCHVE